MNINDISLYYVNDNEKEVVLKKYDMSSPWFNYLSNSNFRVLALAKPLICLMLKDYYRLCRYKRQTTRLF